MELLMVRFKQVLTTWQDWSQIMPTTPTLNLDEGMLKLEWFCYISVILSFLAQNN